MTHISPSFLLSFILSLALSLSLRLSLPRHRIRRVSLRSGRTTTKKYSQLIPEPVFLGQEQTLNNERASVYRLLQGEELRPTHQHNHYHSQQQHHQHRLQKSNRLSSTSTKPPRRIKTHRQNSTRKTPSAGHVSKPSPHHLAPTHFTPAKNNSASPQILDKGQESSQEHLTRNLTSDDIYQQKERNTPPIADTYKPELDCLRRIKFKLSWRYDNIDSTTKNAGKPGENMVMDTPTDDKTQVYDHVISTSTDLSMPECKVGEEREGSEEEIGEEVAEEGVLIDGEVQQLELCATTDGGKNCEGVDDAQQSLEATSQSVDIRQMMTSMTTLYNSTNGNDPKVVEEMAEDENTTLFSQYVSSPMEAMYHDSAAYSNQISDSEQRQSTKSHDDVTMTAYTNQGTKRWPDTTSEIYLKNSNVEGSNGNEMGSFEIKTELIDEGFVDSNNNSEFVMDMNIH
ncbi:uncharacterized protein LOC129270155 [Lytechinus pictus]|uniref:uncharacterized protein LOC129270155 n=1 Tax=Lytechinus pictus TaxID=7653 RepID=UPI0030B9C1F4